MPDMAVRILQTIPDIMPENMSEDTLVRMLEDPQRECQKKCQVICQIESPPHMPRWGSLEIGLSWKLFVSIIFIGPWPGQGCAVASFLRLAHQAPISSRPFFGAPWRRWLLFRYRLDSGQCMPTIFDFLWCLPLASGNSMTNAWMSAQSWILLLIHKSPCGRATSGHL